MSTTKDELFETAATAEHADETAMVAEHDRHSSDAVYWKVAVALFILTGLEVLTYFIADTLGGGLVPILLTLMAVKFVLVVAFFMHLRYDSKLFSQVFWAGLILAVAVYTVVLASFQFFAH